MHSSQQNYSNPLELLWVKPAWARSRHTDSGSPRPAPTEQRARCTKAEALGGRGCDMVTTSPHLLSSAEENRAAGGSGSVPGMGSVLRAGCLSLWLLSTATSGLRGHSRAPGCLEAKHWAVENCPHFRGERNSLNAHQLVAILLKT